MTFGLLQSVLDRREVRLDVVNSDVRGAPASLESVSLRGETRGRLPSWVYTYDGIDAIERYTRVLTDERSGELIRGLEASLPSKRCGPVGSRSLGHVATELHRIEFAIDGPDEEGVVTLRTTPVRSDDHPDDRTGYEPNGEPSEVTLTDLLKRFDGAMSLVATHGDSEPMRLVNYVANIPWLMFIPAGLVT